MATVQVRCIVRVVLLLALTAHVAGAQRLSRVWPHPFHPLAALDSARGGIMPAVHFTPPPGTHAVAGAVIGGLAVGFLGAATGVGLCHFDAPCPHPVPFAIGGFVLGAAAGAAIGFRIGDAFPTSGLRGWRPRLSLVRPVRNWPSLREIDMVR